MKSMERQIKVRGSHEPLTFFFVLQRFHKQGDFMEKILLAFILLCIFAPLLH